MAEHPRLKEPTVARTTQKTPPVAPPEDPLADLRERDDETPPVPESTPGPEEERDQEPEPGEVRPMVSQEVWDAMVTEAVTAWHSDPTSQGFLHGGGSVCGCRYIARVALQAAVPVVTEEDLEEKELEPSE